MFREKKNTICQSQIKKAVGYWIIRVHGEQKRITPIGWAR